MNDKNAIKRIEIIYPFIKVIAKQLAFDQLKMVAANDNKKTH